MANNVEDITVISCFFEQICPECELNVPIVCNCSAKLMQMERQHGLTGKNGLSEIIGKNREKFNEKPSNNGKNLVV